VIRRFAIAIIGVMAVLLLAGEIDNYNEHRAETVLAHTF
jgi:hypothetical protein